MIIKSEYSDAEVRLFLLGEVGAALDWLERFGPGAPSRNRRGELDVTQKRYKVAVLKFLLTKYPGFDDGN